MSVEVTGEALFSGLFCFHVAESLSSLLSVAQLLRLRYSNASENKKLLRSLLIRYTESYPIAGRVDGVVGGSF